MRVFLAFGAEFDVRLRKTNPAAWKRNGDAVGETILAQSSNIGQDTKQIGWHHFQRQGGGDVNTATMKTYRARLRRVLHYIEAHLEDDLSAETLSGVAAFSKFHFHRQFTALFGVGVHKYVQLMRLKRASYSLAFRETRIVEIALESGYAAPEAFSRAFKQCIGQTPSTFRKFPQWMSWHATYQSIGETRNMHMKPFITSEQIRIVETKDTRVAALEHRGDPALIGNSIRAFIGWRKQAGLPPRTSATFNILYDNPVGTPPGSFRLDICAATERGLAPNNLGIVAKVIPSGRCAVLRHIGSEDSFGDAIAFLCRDWLPRSGEEPRDFPLYCQRVSFFPDVPEREAVTDIYLPLR
jgi:AraC family transcriptional regulator